MTNSNSGFSATGLVRLHEVLARHVESGKIPGLVALVSRGGQTHVEAMGTMRHDGGAPMQRDTIFRMASTTKPVAVSAAMVLLDECRLRLDDPVDQWLPELTDRQVLKDLTAHWTILCRRTGRSTSATCSPRPSASDWT